MAARRLCRPRLVALPQLVEPGTEQPGNDLELRVASRIRPGAQVRTQRLRRGPIGELPVLDLESKRRRQALEFGGQALVGRARLSRDDQANDPRAATQGLESSNFFVDPA